MKYLLITLLITNAVLESFSKEILVPSKIEKVKIYLGGAQLFRTIDIPAAKGTYNLVLGGLSASLMENTVHFSNQPNFKVLSFYKQRVVNFKKQENTPENDSLIRFNQKLTSLSGEKEGLEQELTLLKANNSRLANSSQVLTVKDITSFSTYYRNRSKEISERKVWLEDQIEMCREYIQAIKRSIDYKNSQIDESVCNLILLVEKLDDEKTSIDFNYFTPDAGWLPEYDMNCKVKENKIDFTYKAKLLNNSGEEWKNAQLILTTSEPVYFLEKPNPVAWGISFGKTTKRGRTYSTTSSGSEGILNNYVQQESKKNGTKDDFSEIEVPEISKDFVINKKYTVPSLKNPFEIEVYKKEITGTFYFFAFPKITSEVYLIAKIGNWEELELIDGVTNLFYGENYIGQSKISPSVAGDTMEVVVGIDEKITVSKVKRKEKEGIGFLGLNKVESFKYNIFIKNNHSIPITLDLMDQVPITNQNEIEINVKNVSEALHNVNNGNLRWNLVVQPNQTQKVSIEFDIKYPGNEIVNLKMSRGGVRCPKFR